MIFFTCAMNYGVIFFSNAARQETAREKQLKEEEKILESVAEKTGEFSNEISPE